MSDDKIDNVLQFKTKTKVGESLAKHDAKFILDSIQKAIEESGVLEYIHHLRKPVMVDIHVGDPKELL